MIQTSPEWESKKVIILGLGNILCGDDAFGVIAADRLCQEYVFPANVEIVDGGAQGPTLYTWVELADILIVIDAVDFGLKPGQLSVREGSLPCWLGMRKMSAHQNSFAELLALAQLKNTSPQKIFLIGFQPEHMEFGEKLSHTGRDALAAAVQNCLDILSQHGIEYEKTGTGKSLLEHFH